MLSIAGAVFALCLADLLATLLAHRRESRVLDAGGADVEVARRQAEADRARAEAARAQAEVALFAALAAVVVAEHRRRVGL